MAVLNWSDVLTQTGATAQRKGLSRFDGQIVKLADFEVEKRGRGDRREVLTALATPDGSEKGTKVLVPERYAKRLRELPTLDDVTVYARVEVGKRGPMLKPTDGSASDDDDDDEKAAA